MANNNSSLPAGFLRSSRTLRLVLTAAGTEQSIQRLPLAGSKFYIADADSDSFIGIKSDKGIQELFTVGTGKDFDKTGEDYFTALELQNFQAFDIILEFFAGFGEFIDKRTTIVGNRLSSILPTVEPETQGAFVAGATDTIAASTTISLPGIAAGRQLRRKCIVVSNDDPATKLYIRDAAHNRLCVVQPKTEVTLPISGACEVQNPSASVVSATVSEIWWMKPVFV